MLNDFANSELGKKLIGKLVKLSEQITSQLGRRIVLMEVCGTHTVAISKTGIRSILSPYIELRSGPGCPVCVTDQSDIDAIIELSKNQHITIATFGDMIRVPGSFSSLEKERARDARIKICYSPQDALYYASKNPRRNVVFLGVGFETTIPSIALTIASAIEKNIVNFSVYCVHKIIPPAMHILLNDPDLHIDGFILPGHVCTITGRKAFDFISDKYNIPSAIAGFESLDVIYGIYLLLKQISEGKNTTEIAYTRLVHEDGNSKAQEIINQYFTPVDAVWRGFGVIPSSGLNLRTAYEEYDASQRFPVTVTQFSQPTGCSCGEVLRGRFRPTDCPLFGSSCTPSTPVGPCMVSTEGACSAYYLYG